mgnify:FL=1
MVLHFGFLSGFPDVLYFTIYRDNKIFIILLNKEMIFVPQKTLSGKKAIFVTFLSEKGNFLHFRRIFLQFIGMK